MFKQKNNRVLMLLLFTVKRSNRDEVMSNRKQSKRRHIKRFLNFYRELGADNSIFHKILYAVLIFQHRSNFLDSFFCYGQKCFNKIHEKAKIFQGLSAQTALPYLETSKRKKIEEHVFGVYCWGFADHQTKHFFESNSWRAYTTISEVNKSRYGKLSKSTT